MAKTSKFCGIGEPKQCVKAKNRPTTKLPRQKPGFYTVGVIAVPRTRFIYSLLNSSLEFLLNRLFSVCLRAFLGAKKVCMTCKNSCCS